jgi:hypothetical protein
MFSFTWNLSEVEKMYKRIGLDVILRAERRGKGKINVLLFYLIPPQGVSSPLSGVLFFFYFFFS